MGPERGQDLAHVVPVASIEGAFVIAMVWIRVERRAAGGGERSESGERRDVQYSIDRACTARPRCTEIGDGVRNEPTIACCVCGRSL